MSYHKPDFVLDCSSDDHLSSHNVSPLRVRLLPEDSTSGNSSSVVSCFTRGLPSLHCHLWSGGLLLHLFTLTSYCYKAVHSLLHFPSNVLKHTVPHFHVACFPMKSGLSSTFTCINAAIISKTFFVNLPSLSCQRDRLHFFQSSLSLIFRE